MANQPKKLGKYDIVGKLGKGAMGEVYKGHDPVLNRNVAIKVIAESLDADPELIERFRREAKAAAQLNHPNIITIYDFVEEEGSLYIVMELLDGKDLKELIKGGTPLTMEQILGIMEQIADGLGFAHENEMVHRDLKPANIHITKKGQIKILDFGLVHNESSDMTKTDMSWGRPTTCPPNKFKASRSTRAQTFFRSARSSTSCSRGKNLSVATRSTRRCSKWFKGIASPSRAIRTCRQRSSRWWTAPWIRM